MLPRRPLLAWLGGHLPVGPELVVTRISTGHSNEMFRLEMPGQVWLLRRPPRTANAPGAHSMAREFRVLRALRGSGVPHPEALVHCEDPEVVGAPFLVLSFVTGFAPTLPLPAPFTGDVAGQREMAGALVDALAAVARFDWRPAGLDGFGRPDGFLDRQVDRWLGQLARYRTRDLPWLDELSGWLRARQPARPVTGLLHGDYTWSNVMFAPDRPGRVAAVVDWEQSTVGDPLLDLGQLTGLWYEQGEDAGGRDPRALFCQLPGNLTRRELVERYARASGLPVDDIAFYQALALFKLACILEGGWARFRAGASDDPGHRNFERRVPALLARAATFAGLRA
ncbi:hypothetical protein BL253_20785 [Pseudofrankia asymbiotica]|uniref:Aminoglycoside phosphotransferase domain-containing protein n=1 Tax=Pseudofrankia asymbiotica TaxID=1834516 RepID=A0A1V2IA02_9ACTN|nr:hypothetical protein BL253_20785 [Pseudofrankia asymbiotica]